jgi:hypothetical protein
MPSRITHAHHDHPSTAEARSACRDEINGHFDRAVRAYRAIRGVDPNSARWTKVAKAHQQSIARYCGLTGLDPQDVMLEVAQVVDQS